MYDLYDEPDAYVRTQMPAWLRWLLSLVIVVAGIAAILGGIYFLIWLGEYLKLLLIGIGVTLLVGIVRYTVFDT